MTERASNPTTVKRSLLPLAVAAVGFVTFGLPLAVSAEEQTSATEPQAASQSDGWTVAP